MSATPGFRRMRVQPSNDPVRDFEAAYDNMTEALAAAMVAMAHLHEAQSDVAFHIGRIAALAPETASVETTP